MKRKINGWGRLANFLGIAFFAMFLVANLSSCSKDDDDNSSGDNSGNTEHTEGNDDNKFTMSTLSGIWLDYNTYMSICVSIKQYQAQGINDKGLYLGNKHFSVDGLRITAKGEVFYLFFEMKAFHNAIYLKSISCSDGTVYWTDTVNGEDVDYVKIKGTDLCYDYYNKTCISQLQYLKLSDGVTYLCGYYNDQFYVKMQ